MHSKKVPLRDLVLGPFHHSSLPAALVERVKAYKKILGDADPTSIESAIDDFRRDLHPEKEVEVWERITHVFEHFTKGHRITDLARCTQVLAVLLVISTGGDVSEAE